MRDFTTPNQYTRVRAGISTTKRAFETTVEINRNELQHMKSIGIDPGSVVPYTSVLNEV
jgi:hypothetical protein